MTRSARASTSKQTYVEPDSDSSASNESDDEGGASTAEQRNGGKASNAPFQVRSWKGVGGGKGYVVAGRKRVGQAKADGDWDASDFEASRVVKRVRHKVKKGRGNNGKLAFLQTMPLDIFYEIAGHLDPLTLLHMTRVNKAFRKLFMSKSSRSTWISARRNVYLPDLQAEDMSEPAYASLVFEKNCMCCGKPRAPLVDYYIRARWCKKCRKTNLVHSKTVTTSHPHTLLLLPRTNTSLTAKVSSLTLFFKPAVLELDAELCALQAPLDIADELADRAEEEGKGEATQDQQAAIHESITAMNKFIDTRQAIVEGARKDGLAILKWESSSAMERRTSEDDAKVQRRAAIRQKLIDLGYDTRDLQFYSSYNEVAQPRPLTELIWNNIKYTLIAEVQHNKQARLRRELADRATQRARLVEPLHKEIIAALQTPLDKATFPVLDTFIHFAAVKPHWEPEQPDGYHVDQAAWLSSLDSIFADVNKYKYAQKVRYLAKVVGPMLEVGVPHLDHSIFEEASRKPTITEDEMSAVFDHPCAIFLCGDANCRKSIHGYDEIRIHEAQVHGANPTQTFASSVWVAAVQKIAKQAMLDEATEEAIEALGPVLECFDCDAGQNVRYGALWGNPGPPPPPVKITGLSLSELLAHALTHHPSAIEHATQYSPTAPELQLVGVTPEPWDAQKAIAAYVALMCS